MFFFWPSFAFAKAKGKGKSPEKKIFRCFFSGLAVFTPAGVRLRDTLGAKVLIFLTFAIVMVMTRCLLCF
jgi:hypothetical protein